MIDLILIATILVILGLVVWYIIRSKKKGIQCVGCPHAVACAAAKKGSCTSCSSCSGSENTK